MGDPQRLLGSMHEGDELERELLGSLHDVAPHPAAKEETWKRMALSAAAITAVGSTTAAAGAWAPSGGAIAAQVGKVLTAKIVLGLAVAAPLAVGGGIWLHRRSLPAPVLPTPSADQVALPPPLVDSSPAETTVEPPQTAPPPPKAPVRAGKSGEDGRARRDSLMFESRMLTEARARLYHGDPRGALATLERLRAESPKAVLGQERDVLTIQVLSALGDATAAKRKAREFLRAYPESPHAVQLRRLAADP